MVSCSAFPSFCRSSDCWENTNSLLVVGSTGGREETDRIQAELAAADRDWQEWVNARRRVGTVSVPDGGGIADEKAASGSQDTERTLGARTGGETPEVRLMNTTLDSQCHPGASKSSRFDGRERH